MTIGFLFRAFECSQFLVLGVQDKKLGCAIIKFCSKYLQDYWHGIIY